MTIDEETLSVIDEKIRETIRLLNEFPFLRTIGSCQGHPEQVMPLAITFQVSDEVAWLELCRYVQRGLRKKDLLLNVQHRYFFEIGTSCWEWESFHFAEEHREELDQTRTELEQLVRTHLEIFKYQESKEG